MFYLWMPPFFANLPTQTRASHFHADPSGRRPLKPESCEWSPWRALAKNSWTSSAPCRKRVKTKMPALSMVCKVCGGFGGPFGLDILSQFNVMVFEEGQHQSIMNCSATEQGSTSQIKWDETTQPDQPSNTSSHHTWRGMEQKLPRYIHLLGFVHTSAEWLTA